MKMEGGALGAACPRAEPWDKKGNEDGRRSLGCSVSPGRALGQDEQDIKMMDKSLSQCFYKIVRVFIR